MARHATGPRRRLLPAPMAAAMLVGLAGQPAHADPAAVVAKLRATTASLFDLSLARLEAEVNGDGSGRGFDAYVNYQDGEIVIFGSSARAPVTEKACHGIIDAIKLAGDVDPKTGNPDEPASGYASLFAYPEVDQAAVDNAYMESVDSMLVIQVTLGTTGDGKAITCRSKLLSPDVTYQRN
jgi:hypothetical protein